MKKIFSAFLLMTMMVFSVGSFVSCSDIEKEIANLDSQATENAAAIADLNSKIAALQTALNAAQADADAAQKAADAAAAAAATAKADAIAAAKAEVEKAVADLQAGHKTDIDAVNAKVASVEAALALKADIATVELLAATLENYKATLSAEDTAIWTTVSELQEQLVNLQGTIATQGMSIEDLTAAVNQAVADVKAINEGLVGVYNLVAALANQIQSIVYVPETADGKAVAQGYALGTAADAKKTDLLVKMTYEVSPKGLATAITSENAAFSTVPVKAAAAEYFEVEVADADASTGRVVVFAHIPTTSEAYKHIAKDGAQELALSLNVADEAMVALLFSDEPQMVDAGTYVQSAYTGVKEAASGLWDNVLDNFVIYDDVKNEPITGKVNPKFEVPYNTSPAVTNLFAGYDLRALVDGTYMTVAEAAKFTGFEFEVKNEFKVNYKNPKNEKVAADDADYNPFTVTGKDFSATAQFANTEELEDAELVGYYLEANSYKYTVNGVKVDGHVMVTYVITEKKSDFGFSAVNVAWKHDLANPLVAVAPAQELAVVNADANFDITKTDINKTEFVAEWKYLDSNNKEQTATAKAKVNALSSKAVKLVSIDALPFTKGAETTYTFKGNVVYNKVNYTVAFDVKLGAMPTDKVIDLNNGQPINIAAATKGSMTIKNVTPVTQAMAHIKATDSSLEAMKDFALTNLVAGKQTVKVDTKAPTTETVAINFGKTDDKKNEKSTVVVNGLTKYDNTIEVAYEYTLFGVKFTYTATIVTAEPEIAFGPAAAYVTSENKVNLDGTVKFEYADANKTATKSATKYVLNEIDLNDYVDVTIPTDLANDFVLRYTLKSNPYVKEYNTDGTIKTWKDDPESTTDPKAKFSTANLPAFSNGSVTSVKLAATATCPITWRSDMREMVYEIALVSTTPAKDEDGKDVDNVFDSFEVTLVVPELVKTFAADKEIKVKYENGKTATANIAGAFTVVDKFDNVIYNAYAPTLSDIWNGYALDKDGKLTTIQNAGFFNAYGQKIVLPAAKDVKAYIGSADVTSQVKPTLAADGTVTIQPESANLTGDVVVKVPVKLTYIYDEHGAQAKTAEVSVVFSLTEGATETPGAVAYEVPSGQWYAKQVGSDVEYLFDFGTATVTAWGGEFTNVFSIGGKNMNDPEDDTFYFASIELSKFEFVAETATSGIIRTQFFNDFDTDGKTPLWAIAQDAHTYSDYTGTTMTVNYGGVAKFNLTKVADADVQTALAEPNFGPSYE